MAVLTLTRGLQSFKISEVEQRLVWHIGGEHGAVTMSALILPIGVLQTSGVPALDAGVHYLAEKIGVHSPFPPAGVSTRSEQTQCLFLGDRPCWYDSGALAADRLLEMWGAYGFDDEVIYGELAEWHRDRFAVLPTPAETWPVRCVHCAGEVAGLLAACPNKPCIPREIADAVRLDRDIEAAEG